MKNLLIGVLLFGLVGITSCDTTKRLTKICERCPTHDSINYVETVTENPYYTIPDTAYWQMLFYCDSSNTVLLRELEEGNTGLNTVIEVKKVPYEDKSKLNAILFTLRVSSDSILTLNRTIEKLKNEVKTVVVEKEVIKYKTRPFFTYWFIGSLAEHLIILAFLWFRFKTKILGFIK